MHAVGHSAGRIPAWAPTKVQICQIDYIRTYHRDSYLVGKGTGYGSIDLQLRGRCQTETPVLLVGQPPEEALALGVREQLPEPLQHVGSGEHDWSVQLPDHVSLRPPNTRDHIAKYSSSY